MTRTHLRLSRPEPKEADVLAAIKQALALLELRGRVVWWARMNTGKGKVLRANGSASQWQQWGFTGCPDILGQLNDGRVLAIEVKRPSGKLRPEQDAFLSKAAGAGACAFVARSVDDVWRAVGFKWGGE